MVMNMKLASLPVLTVLVVASFCPVYALDCGNASLQVEKLICTSPELKKADDAMSAAYFRLLHQTTDPEFHDALVRSQRRWLQARARGVPRIDGTEDDEEPDDRKVLLKITGDRLNFLGGTRPIRTMEQQRNIASKDGGGPFAGYEASCQFLPRVIAVGTMSAGVPRIVSTRTEFAASRRIGPAVTPPNTGLSAS